MSGIRFNSGGRVFSPRGLNFVKSDGTCVPCDCDNPPGSGRNTVGCAYCTANVGPASALISFTGITYASCAPISPPGSNPRATQAIAVSKIGSYSLGSYCVGSGGCGGFMSIPGPSPSGTADIRPGFYTDPSCPGSGGFNSWGLEVGWQYSGRDSIGTGPIGWTVFAYNIDCLWFYGFKESDGDCTTPVTVPNMLTAGQFFNNAVYAPRTTGGSTGGAAILTPQFMLCS